MKKLFALLLLPSLAFAGKIGENYVGAKLGATNFGVDISGVDVELDGFSFKLAGNYNIYSQNSYAIDLNLDFHSASDLDGIASTEADFTKFDALIRPHMNLSDITVFANLGFSTVDGEIKNSTDTLQIDESTFSPGLGFEVSFDKLTITPSVDWVDYHDEADGVLITLPISYVFNDKVSFSFEYEMGSFDDFPAVLGGSNVRAEYIYDSIMFGIDYKF